MPHTPPPHRTSRPRRTFRRAIVTAAAVVVCSVASPTVAQMSVVAPHWGRPALLSRPTGDPTSISCPTETWCMAVDASSNAFTGIPGAWSQPMSIHVGLVLSGVSCVSSTFCVAVGSERLASQRYHPIAVTFAAGVWSRPVRLRYGVTRVSCTSDTFCMAVGNIDTERFDGTIWKPAGAATYPNDLQRGISCVSTSFCMVVTRHGFSSSYDGTGWSSPFRVVPLGQHLMSVSCPTSLFCAAVGDLDAVQYQDGAWTAPTRISPEQVLTTVSCVGTAFCMANGRGVAVRWNGTGWDAATRIAGHIGTGVVGSCPATEFCAVVTNIGDSLAFDGSTWRRPELFDPQSSALDHIACASASFCVATDDVGDVLTDESGHWSKPLRVDTAFLTAIACPSSSMCVGVDWRGNAVTYDGSSWSAPSPVASGDYLMHLSCPTTTFCAVGTAGESVFMFDGTSWTAAQPPIQSSIAALSCSSPAFCLLTETDELQVVWDGSSWTSEQPSNGYQIESLSCPSPVRCVGVSDLPGQGILGLVYDGTAWGGAHRLGPGFRFEDVSCLSSTDCQLLGDNGLDIAFDGTGWSAGSQADPGGDGTVALSCASGSSFCALLDHAGRVRVTQDA